MLRDVLRIAKQPRGAPGRRFGVLVCAVAAMHHGPHGTVCTLVDGSGQSMVAWMQRDAVAEAGRALDLGAAVTLRGASVIEPAPGKHYLSVTADCLLRVLPPTTVYRGRAHLDSGLAKSAPTGSV